MTKVLEACALRPKSWILSASAVCDNSDASSNGKVSGTLVSLFRLK